MFRGVFTAEGAAADRATCPISVLSPTAVTTRKPVPLNTIDERRTIHEG